MEKGKEDFGKAKDKLEDVKKDIEEFVEEYGKIIRKSLISIIRDQQPEEQATKEILAMREQLGQMETEAIGTNTELISKYRYMVFEYNMNMMSRYFEKTMNTEEGLRKIGEELKKDNEQLGRYIYEELQKKTEESIIIEEVKYILYVRIAQMMDEKVKNE